MRNHPCLQPLLAAIRRARSGRTSGRYALSLACAVPWEEMAPLSDGVRYCDRCHQQVFDLRGKSNAEIQDAIVASDGALCGQVSVRADGLVVSGDCAQQQPTRVLRGRIRPVE